MRKVGMKNILAWGSGDVFGSGAMTVIGLWMLYFYTEVAGLSPVAAGSIFAIAKIWDGFTDPVMGYITDNIRTRWGRRRVFFLFGAPFILIYATMWISGFGYWYYLLTYIAFNTVITVLMVPYDTLPAEMTTDYKTRSKMTGARMMFAQVTAFLVTFIPGQIMAVVEDQAAAFMIIGVVFAIMFTLPWIAVYLGTWERCDSEPDTNDRGLIGTMINLYKEMFSTFSLKTFRIHLMMYVGGSVALDIFGSMFMYYMTYVLMVSATEGANAMSVMTLFQFIGVPIFTFLCMRIGNGHAHKVAISLLLGSLVFFYGLSADMGNLMFFIFAASVIMGLARGGTYMIPWNVYNFLPDADEALTGSRREGIYAGVMMLSRKICQAAALFIVGLALQHFGFVSGAETQTPEAIQGITWTFLAGPALLAGMAILGAFLFRLSEKNHEILITEVERLRAGGSMQDVSEEARRVIEEVTGHPYENTWGNNKHGKQTASYA